MSNNDLILIDQKASGDSQNMIGAPMNFLFDKKSVYFFNPDDLKNIDTKKYNKVYLIVPKNMISYYKETSIKDKLVPFKEYSIKTVLLFTESNKISFPKKETVVVEGMIFEIKK